MGQKHRPNKTNKNPTPFLLYIQVLAATLCFTTISTALAETEFQGSLNGVSITDAAGLNSSPTAVINFTQTGDTFNFDASESNDSDGSIVRYKWDFGDGATGSEAVVSHLYVLGSFSVTLTTIDDAGGVALSRQLLTLEPEQQAICVGKGESHIDCGLTITPDKIITLNIDRTTVYRWAPQENGTANRVKIYFGNPTNGDWADFDNLQVVVYRGKEIMATASISPISNAWVWSEQLVAQSGQDLIFDTSNDIYFGLTVNVTSDVSSAPGCALGSFVVSQNPSYYYKNEYMPYGTSWGVVNTNQVATILEYFAL